jgi:MFS family permease
MGERQRLGRRFGWLWSANAVSSFGTSFALGAFSLIAVRVLHASALEVAALPAAGLAAGAILAVPAGPWIEGRRKRPVMIAMDLVRFLAMATLPVAYALGVLGFWQLLVVAVVTAAAKITFASASGSYLKSLVPRDKLLVANGRFGSTGWTVTAVGPPLGGAAITLLGPVATVTADAVSYLLSAAGILAINGEEPYPERSPLTPRPPAPSSRQEPSPVPSRGQDLLAGWRYIFADPVLRRLMANGALTGALILATEPLLAILLLGQLKFTAWMYGMAFGIPCAGGFVASRLASRLTARFGRQRMLLIAGTARACFPLGLAFTFTGFGGLAFFIVVQAGLIFFMGLYTPVYATYRLELLGDSHVARGLTAYSITSNATTALLTALWGVLATLTSARVAIAVAGVLLLTTPALLPRGGTGKQGGSVARNLPDDLRRVCVRGLRGDGPGRPPGLQGGQAGHRGDPAGDKGGDQDEDHAEPHEEPDLFHRPHEIRGASRDTGGGGGSPQHGDYVAEDEPSAADDAEEGAEERCMPALGGDHQQAAEQCDGTGEDLQLQSAVVVHPRLVGRVCVVEVGPHEGDEPAPDAEQGDQHPAQDPVGAPYPQDPSHLLSLPVELRLSGLF